MLIFSAKLSLPVNHKYHKQEVGFISETIPDKKIHFMIRASYKDV